VRGAVGERKEDPCQMSDQFYYIDLKFIPKIVILTFPILRQREVVVEVPKDLVQQRLSEMVHENPGEEAIALILARRAALTTFPTVAEQLVGMYDEGVTWDEHRYHVMNERPCDHEENGVRAWRII
jgi:hypothetical protein